MLRILSSLILITLLTQCTTAKTLTADSLAAKLGRKIIPMNIITHDNQCLEVRSKLFGSSLLAVPCSPTLEPNWLVADYQGGVLIKYQQKQGEWQCLLHKNAKISLGSCQPTQGVIWKKKPTKANHYKLITPNNSCLSQQPNNEIKLVSCNDSDLAMVFQLSLNHVTVSGGEVVGLQFGNTARFMGIPFAKPPIDKRRFMPPESLANESWKGSLLAFNPSYMCPQRNFKGKFFGTEDCLYLNIWTPQPSMYERTKKPVMVWIHGGGLTHGGSYYSWPGRSKNYNGRKLSELGDVVIVTFNYRLGALGLLGTKGKFKGNNALKDQIAALNWVHENINKFGGDASNVTIFGESAGAWSVCALLASPSADLLFHKAIMESGACTSTTVADHDAADDWIINNVGCWAEGKPEAQEQCLMKTTAQTLTKAWDVDRPKSIKLAKVFVIAPYVDGETLPIPPLEAIAQGYVNKPLIHGIDKEELADVSWILSLAGVIDFNDPKVLESIVENPSAKAHVAPTLAFYKDHDLGEGELIDDVLFNCINWQLANGLANTKKPVFSFLFNMPVIFDINIHTEGVPYVFQQVDSPVSRDVGLRWTHFAKTGNPNLDSLVNWPSQEPQSLKQLEIDKDPAVVSWPEKETCKMLQQFLPWTVIGRNAGWIPTPEQDDK